VNREDGSYITRRKIISMASTSGTRLSRRLLLLALLLSCFCSSRSTMAQEKVRLDTLYIKVIEKNTGRPLPSVNISISRGGTYDNLKLRDLNLETNTQGEVSKREVDFDFTDDRAHTLTLDAEGYKTPAPLLLNDLIKQSSSQLDKKLSLPIELERLGEDRSNNNLNANTVATDNNVNTAGTENVNRTTTTTDPASKPFDWFGIPAFFSWVVDGVNYVAFWLGWLTILLLIGLVVRYFVIRRRRRGTHHFQPPLQVSLETLDAGIRDLKAQVRNAATKEEIKALQVELQNVSQSIKDIQLPGSTTRDGRGRGGSGGVQGDGSTAVVATVAETKPPVHLPFKERAHHSYLKLANRETPDHEPLYVEAHTKTTLFGKMADSTVYLAQATHRQSAFVLFTEDDKYGWVFPHPMLAFRKTTLKDVFPNLTEEVFDGAKERIEPVPVVRVDESRWKVS